MLALDIPLGKTATGWGAKFGENGQNSRALPILMQWQGGKLVTVSPKEAAVAKLHFPGLDPAAAAWLIANRSISAIGIDTASIDPASSKALPSHQAVRRLGLRVLENLVLDDVPEGDYELIALPLRLPDFDASPVRAVLRSSR